MNATQNTIDGKTFAIGVLSITACILFVGFLLIAATPTPAYGIGQIDRGGDYIMLTEQLSTTQEGVVVIDAATKQMSVYSLDVNRKQLVMLERNVPLSKLPGAARGRGGP